MEKVKNFNENYIESEKFFSKFSYENFGDFVFKKVSENKNKTNYLINLEWCYYFKFFSQLLLLLLLLNLEWFPGPG